MTWVEQIQTQLDERDQLESQCDGFVLACKYDTCQHEKLTKGGIVQEAAKRATVAGGGTNHREEDSDDDEITKLYSDLSIKEDQLQKLKTDMKELGRKYTRAKELVESGKTNEESLKQANKTIQSLEDDMLALQIQVNVTDEKNAKLTRENQQLVERWMARVAGEADQLNEANAFIERANKMRKGSEQREDATASSTGNDVNMQSDSE